MPKNRIEQKRQIRNKNPPPSEGVGVGGQKKSKIFPDFQAFWTQNWNFGVVLEPFVRLFQKSDKKTPEITLCQNFEKQNLVKTLNTE